MPMDENKLIKQLTQLGNLCGGRGKKANKKQKVHIEVVEVLGGKVTTSLEHALADNGIEIANDIPGFFINDNNKEKKHLKPDQMMYYAMLCKEKGSESARAFEIIVNALDPWIDRIAGQVTLKHPNDKEDIKQACKEALWCEVIEKYDPEKNMLFLN